MLSNSKFGLIILIIVVVLIITSCKLSPTSQGEIIEDSRVVPDYSNSKYKEIYLAGGCFWGVQAYFNKIIGVEYTNVGYANGESDSTDYYSIGKTGHAEAIYLVYDPEIISLEDVLVYFYGLIDPVSVNKQGNDRGSQYRSGIYYIDSEDLETINLVTQREQEKYSKPIATEIQELRNYVLGEEEHQDYLYKNPRGYCHIDLENIPSEKPSIKASDYPKPSDKEIKEKLTDLQYGITQENNTERAFENPLWNNYEEGIYVDIVTGEPLFLSIHKYDSGTGWPSFTRPIDWNVVKYNVDKTSGMERIEVRSRVGDSHLGHVFKDGPKDEGGLRYCINSGAMEFILLEEMEKKGYGQYMVYFN